MDERVKEFVSTRVAIAGLLVAIFAYVMVMNEVAIQDEEFTFQSQALVDAENDSTLGVTTDPNLDFGQVPAGASVRKSMDIDTSQLTFVKINSRGNISNNIQYPSTLLLEEGSDIELEFNSSEPGYYEGELNVKAYVSNNRIGERWLRLRAAIGY